jgi:hypothetical protein
MRQNALVFDGDYLFDLYDHEGKKWLARSGPWGKGPAPPGLYTMGKAYDWAEPHPSFTDQHGLCWWAPLTPLFETERSGFGIHPDGGVEGTKGCIGISTPDTSSCYHYLRRLSAPVYVVVLPPLGVN